MKKLDLIITPKAFSNAKKCLEIESGRTLKEILDFHLGEVPEYAQAYVCINDTHIKPEHWHLVTPNPDTYVTVGIVPQGGGDDKNPLRIIAQIAVMAATNAFGAKVGAKLFGTSASWAAGVGSAIVGYSASLIMNAIVPPPRQRAQESQGISADKPIQSITGVQNQLVPYGSVPFIFGNVKMYPPLAAVPYTELENNEQYLRMIFCVGYEEDPGDLFLSDIKIGENALSTYDGVEIEYTTRFADMTADQKSKWFPNINEASVNQTLNQSDGYRTNTTTTNTTGIIVDISFPSLVKFNTSTGAKESLSVDFDVEYKPTSGSVWYPFDPDDLDETTENSLNTNRSYFRADSYATTKIFACGGIDSGGTYLNTSEEYDKSTGNWTNKANMSTARAHHASVAIGSLIYVFGGKSGAGTTLDSCEVYNTATNSWSSLTAMPAQRSHLACNYFQTDTDNIYIYGGLDSGGSATSTLWVYNITDNSWTTALYTSINATAPALYGHQLIKAYNRLIIVGGTSNGSTANGFIWEITAHEYQRIFWGTGKVYQITRREQIAFGWFIDAVEYADYVYLTGGTSNGSDYLDDVYAKKFVQWQASNPVAWDTSLENGVRGHQSAVIENTLYIIGGERSGGVVGNVSSSGKVSKTVTASSTSTVRKSYRVEGLDAGQYDVRIRRTTADNSSSNISDSATWTALRSIRTGEAVVDPNAKTICLRIKASNQLNGVIDNLSCVVQAKQPIWSGSAWIKQITRDPAWAFANVLFSSAAKTLLASSRVDATGLYNWAARNATAGRYFDYVLEEGMVRGDLLDMIASTGRASKFWKDGKYSVIEDQTQSTYVQVFGPRNIVKDSFQAVYNYKEIPHAFRVRFKNRDEEFQEEVRLVYRDGYNADGSSGNTAASKFEDLELPGVTTSDHAFRLARYYFAVGLNRPEIFKWKSQLDHLVCTRGDLVGIQHDAALIGLGSARIASVTNNGSFIDSVTIDRGISTASGTNYTLRVRKSDGSTVERVVTVASTAENTLFTITTPADAIGAYGTGDLVLIGEENTEMQDVVIREIIYEPGDFIAEIQAVPAFDIDSVVDGEAIPTYTSSITIPPEVFRKVPPVPVVKDVRSDEFVLERDSDGSLVSGILITTNYSSSRYAPATYLQARFKLSGDTDGPWKMIAPVPAEESQIKITGLEDLQEYALQIRHISKEGQTSAWVGLSNHTVQGKTNPPPDVSNLTSTVQDTNVLLSWDKVTVPDLWKYEIRVGASWASGSVVDVVDGTTFTIDALTAGSYVYMIKAIDTSGNYSTTEDTVTVTINAPGTPQNLSGQSRQGTALLSWTSPAFSSPRQEHGVRFYKIYRSLSSETFSNATLIAESETTTYAYQEASAGTYKYYISAVCFGGNESATPASIELEVDDSVNFILQSTTTDTDFTTGTATGLSYELSGVYPLIPTTPWQTVHSNNSWTSVQDQIDAGYTYFVQPTLSSGSSYERVIDLGVQLGNGKITVTQSQTAIEGTLTTDVTISVSKDGVSYTDYVNPVDLQLVVTGFRYVKVLFEYSGDGTTIARLNSVTITVNAKPIQETGTGITGAGGSVTVTPILSYNVFASVIVTPSSGGATPLLGYADLTNEPTSFDAYVINTSGVGQVGETFSYVIIGY